MDHVVWWWWTGLWGHGISPTRQGPPHDPATPVGKSPSPPHPPPPIPTQPPTLFLISLFPHLFDEFYFELVWTYGVLLYLINVFILWLRERASHIWFHTRCAKKNSPRNVCLKNMNGNHADTLMIYSKSIMRLNGKCSNLLRYLSYLRLFKVFKNLPWGHSVEQPWIWRAGLEVLLKPVGVDSLFVFTACAETAGISLRY